MIISKDFRIKGQYGPVGGNTYYTTSTFEKSSTNINDYAITTAPLKSFDGPEKCTATTENESVVGGTISAYLLDSTGTILVSDSTNTGVPCSGMEKLLGVMNMSSDLTISRTTKGLKMKTIVEPSLFYISNGKFGVSWKVTQIKLSKSTEIQGCAFLPDSDDDLKTIVVSVSKHVYGTYPQRQNG